MRKTLRAFRKDSGLSADQAADMLQVPPNTWRNWELGKTAPDAVKIQEIQKLLGIVFSDIIFLPRVTTKN